MKILTLAPPLFLISLHTASAEVLRIEPDLYDEGADLTAVDPYVELRVADEFNVPLELLKVTANDRGKKSTPTGANLFGHSDVGYWPSTRRFYAKFDLATDFVSIQFTGIASNDSDENPFDVSLSGNAITLPEIAVRQGWGFDSRLKDGLSVRNYGDVRLDRAGKTMTFMIRNIGNAPLKDVGISIRGMHPADYKVVEKPNSWVAPGESTKFNIQFKPKSLGFRSATLRIHSNDKDENPFRIRLKGRGI